MKSKITWCFALGLLLLTQFAFAQQKTVTGTVTDGNNMPLPGVNIVVQGTSVGTQTDFDGNYSVRAEQGQELIFSYVGFEEQQKTVGATSIINVEMTAGESLDEVIVVGFGEREEDKILQSVAVVGGDEIDDIPAQNPQDLLQGQASGVSITSASGVLGARSSIRIRGVNSLTGGAQPLFVVDGVALDDSAQTFTSGGGALNPLATINPESIASLTVLKDAAATAIYGSRGSNGVILITTKKGKVGQAPSVQFESFVQVSNATDLPTILSNQQYGQFYSDVLNISNGVNTFSPEVLRDNFGLDFTGPGFDWLGGVTRTGYTYTQNASVTGGGESSTYYLGFNYSDAEGFIIGNELETRNFRLNLTSDINDDLRVGGNAQVSFANNDRIGEENSTFAPITAAQLIRPNAVPRNEAGDFIPSGQTGQNVIGIEALNTFLVKTTRLLGNVYGEFDFFDDQFTFRSSLGLDKRFVENIFRSSEVFTPGGSAENAIGQVENINANNTLNWSNSFGNHNLGALVGLQYQKTNTRFLDAATTNFLTDALPNVGSGSEPSVTSSTTSESSLFGYFGQLNYDYDGKYLVEGSVRRDGSSRFGSENRFGTFYAVAAGWNISAESFMDGSIFNRLRLRGSYGTTGNDRIGDFTSQATFGSSDYNGNPGLTNTGPALPGLKWEETKTLDLGVKIGVLQDRFRLNVNYYKKNTDNLLINVPVPSATGFRSVTRNAGEIENSGFEFDLGVTAVQSDDFSWELNFNLSTLQNEVLALPGAGTDVQGRQFLQGTPAQRAIVGESANSFYLIRYVGVNPDTGDAEWLTRDGDVTSSPTPDDRVIVGDANPDFYGGFRTTFKYKNWDLNGLFNFSYGNDILIDGDRFTRNADFIGSFNLSTDVLNYWTEDNRNAFVPSPASATFSTYQRESTLQLYDGSFLRFKNVTLGYNFPKTFLDNVGFIKGLRIYGTATNLFTIKGDRLDGIDPEVTDSLNPLALGESFFVAPQSKSYIIGAKLTF
ncbi:TonB-linked SusC/RagA family outer membrane protein [Leeuwenhoekiella aestuarii]|uniref:TonB-linked SusC/RagA family outer membrane protein n=1 Tax=Leeuwenhoekiella aestuarii TaxID=2249426 RepID=A0A4Q0NPP1_9FLAO|nr:TonB-dependent receptor [Leeuwenhoekiella aestuarii]RXG11347.1 TonB-linked SusC/RagA family outer membrane protein [Leeuwenhoekiella aestuarii]RXG11770.1 TonB-linked SusC/RagA family outer membrane protein [Leeuwenhoekiella aestuarii]